MPDLQSESAAASAATETSAAMADTTLRIERVFDAPVETVYRAWTDPEMLVQWWGPEGMTTPHCEMDVRVDGKWRTCMQGADGDHWVQGSYVEIVENKKLVFTWAWETDGVPGDATTVTVEFVPEGDATRLTLTHEGFATVDGRNGHDKGWRSSFDCLEKHLKH